MKNIIKSAFLKSTALLLLLFSAVGFLSACNSGTDMTTWNTEQEGFSYKVAFFNYDYGSISSYETNVPIIDKYCIDKSKNTAEARGKYEMPELIAKISNTAEKNEVVKDFEGARDPRTNKNELVNALSKYNSNFFKENSLILMAYGSGPDNATTIGSVVKNGYTLEVTTNTPEGTFAECVNAYALILLEVKKGQTEDVSQFEIKWNTTPAIE